jgi:hypothetical protein
VLHLIAADLNAAHRPNASAGNFRPSELSASGRQPLTFARRDHDFLPNDNGPSFRMGIAGELVISRCTRVTWLRDGTNRSNHSPRAVPHNSS